MPVSIAYLGDWDTLWRDAAERVQAAAVSQIGERLPDGTINIKLVDDAESARLNEQYTGNAYATDVLTFNYAEDGDATDGEVADVAISTETAAKQAEAAGTGMSDEIGLLVLHSLLHIAGYDHPSPAEQDHLEALQSQIMDLAGLKYRNFEWKD